jgi:hypothetical protein
MDLTDVLSSDVGWIHLTIRTSEGLLSCSGSTSLFSFSYFLAWFCFLFPLCFITGQVFKRKCLPAFLACFHFPFSVLENILLAWGFIAVAVFFVLGWLVFLLRCFVRFLKCFLLFCLVSFVLLLQVSLMICNGLSRTDSRLMTFQVQPLTQFSFCCR